MPSWARKADIPECRRHARKKGDGWEANHLMVELSDTVDPNQRWSNDTVGGQHRRLECRPRVQVPNSDIFTLLE